MSAWILVVDDEEYVRNLVCDTLAVGGYRARTAGTGEEALAEISERTFDLVICDVMMPGIGGLDLVRRIKQLSPSTRVVILTGYSREQDISEYLLRGADEFLPKPFQVKDLLATVSRLVGAGS